MWLGHDKTFSLVDAVCVNKIPVGLNKHTISLINITRLILPLSYYVHSSYHNFQNDFTSTIMPIKSKHLLGVYAVNITSNMMMCI